MSSTEIDRIFSSGPRIVRASGVPTYATSWRRSKTTSSICDSTSCISRMITSRSRSTLDALKDELSRMSESISTMCGTSFFRHLA